MLCLYVCMLGAWGGQKRVSDAHELEFWVAVGSGNQTLVLCKSKCSTALHHLYHPSPSAQAILELAMAKNDLEFRMLLSHSLCGAGALLMLYMLSTNWAESSTRILCLDCYPFQSIQKCSSGHCQLQGCNSQMISITIKENLETYRMNQLKLLLTSWYPNLTRKENVWTSVLYTT